MFLFKFLSFVRNKKMLLFVVEICYGVCVCRRRQSRERDGGDHMSERERDEQERKKFMSAAKMKRVSFS